MSTNPDRDRAWTMHVFHETYGDGPWTCEECDEEIIEIGQGRYDGNVHHRNDNVADDSPGNLVVLHTVCHQRLHPVTEEMKARISAKLKGRPSPTRGMTFSDETRAKMSAASTGELNGFYGRTHDIATLEKMRTPRVRVVCETCGRNVAINWKTRHVCL